VLSYRDDFAKYAGKIPTRYLEETFAAIPHLLGQKFVYSHVNSDVKATVVKDALNLLCKARVCYKVNATPANGLPLLAGVDHRRFKVEFIDVGLVSTLLELRLDQIEATKDINLINQGALSEQVVAQLLRCTVPEYIEAHNYYWCREEKSSNAEVDYIISHHSEVIPVEVKSGTTGSLKSLHIFMQLKKRKLGVRINSDVPSFVKVNVKSYDSKPVNYELLSIPFYLIEQLPRLLDSLSGTRHATK
jgi:predicted AAA+ superfamily ATPase